jgi:hypothetical protein
MYGVVGEGIAPKKVIEAALNDLGTEEMYVIPWYGKVTEGMEVVYDWMLDNRARFHLVISNANKPAPKVLRAMAESIRDTTDIDREVISVITTNDGTVLLMWDENDESQSVNLATMSIDHNLPTLELTNGLVPIVFDAQPEVVVPDLVPDVPVAEEEDIYAYTKEVEDELAVNALSEAFDRATLEVMPAAAVKRMAKAAGHDPRTKEDAINMLLGDGPDEDTSSPLPEVEVKMAKPAAFYVVLDSGAQIHFNLNNDLLSKVVDLVAAYR